MPASVHELIAAARLALGQAGIAEEDAALDAEVLARHALGWDRAALIARGRDAPPHGFEQAFAQLVMRRAAREPVALITGHREFWGLDFEVTRDVLVPRPETELLVEAALSLGARSAHRIADIGTGSGCIAAALATECPQAYFVATDISAAALAVAGRNASRHDVSARVHFVRASLLDALAGPFNLIVSNPPYVPTGDELPAEVSLYEPASALFAGDDGLDVVRDLIGSAASRLSADGWFIVEFGFGQADTVERLARSAGWSDVTIQNDLQGIPRVAVMRRG